MTNFSVLDVAQRSQEWHQARCGRVTGTRAADMLSTIKSGEAAARRDLRMTLVCERLTGLAQEDGFVNRDMQRGIDLEPAALAAYEAQTGQVVHRSGFLSHNTLLAGCSLDGHVGAFTGIVEVKCPKSATHLRYLRAGTIPSEYLPQITHNLWISGAQWADFFSFDDRFPLALRTVRVRVLAKSLNLLSYEKNLCAFLAETENELRSIQTITDLPGVLAAAVAG